MQTNTTQGAEEFIEDVRARACSSARAQAVDAGRRALVAAEVIADVMFTEATAVMGDVGWGDNGATVRDAIVRAVASGPTRELTWSVGEMPVVKFTYRGPGDEWRLTMPDDGPHGVKIEIHPPGTVCRRATTAHEVCLAVASTPLFAHAMAQACGKNAVRLTEEARARAQQRHARQKRRDVVLFVSFLASLALAAALALLLT